MSQDTPFAGLLRLSPGEPMDPRFLGDNIDIIDRMLQVGAVTHRHDAHAALANPDPDVELAVEIDPDGGTIPADLTIYVGYTWVDADGGETALSADSLVSTAAGLVSPTDAPDAVVDHAAGDLTANTYTYGLTISDGLGGETELGSTVPVTVDPGYPNSQITLSGLAAILADSEGTEWRLYRARGAGPFVHITSGTGDTVTDDDSLCPHCDEQPPQVGTTANTNRLLVPLPDGPWPTGVASLRLYGSVDGSFQGACLLGTYLPADAGVVKAFTALTLESGQPPAVNRSLPGAHKIDPDTELVDWHWKRPVPLVADLPAEADEGDVRIVLDDGLPRVFLDDAWGLWTFAAVGHVIQDEGSDLAARANLNFVGAGVEVTDDSGSDATIVTIDASSNWNPLGAWSNATVYAVDDVVERNGSSFVAVAAGVDHDPETDDGSFWVLVASKGADGADGGGGGGTIDMSGNDKTVHEVAVLNFSAVDGATVDVDVDDGTQTAVVQIGGTPEAISFPAYMDELGGVHGVTSGDEGGTTFADRVVEDFSSNATPTGWGSHGNGITAANGYIETTSPSAGSDLLSYWTAGGAVLDTDRVTASITMDYTYDANQRQGIAVEYAWFSSMLAIGHDGAGNLALWAGDARTAAAIHDVPMTGGKPAQDTKIYFRCTRQGDTVIVEEFRADPALGGDPNTSFTFTLTGADATNYGAGINTYTMGTLLHNGPSAAAHFDDFKIETASAAPDTRSTEVRVIAKGAGGDQDILLLNDEGESDLMTPEDWTAATLAGAWVNDAGKAPAAYYKDRAGTVHLRGRVKTGGAAPTTIFTLPAGYRPEYDADFMCVANDAVSRVTINATTGVVSQETGSDTWLSLHGISFRAA